MSAGPPVAVPGKVCARSGVVLAAVSPLALSLRFLQSQPDSRLVALVRDGHAPAFETIVRRYRQELLAYCRRLQPRWGNAEDALQQTLLQAWRALTSGAEVREVRPWLYRIAHNVVVSDLRSPSAAPQELEAPTHGPDIDQLVEQRLRARATLDAMAALPTLQRQALVSTTFNGASRAEVAAALGLSHGAVRGLVYRARETLRAAAAAITPSPALGWALRRAEATSGSSRAAEAFAGGGGASVAGLLLKGTAVITLAGGVAGSGSILLPSHAHHGVKAQAAVAHHAGVPDRAAGDGGPGREWTTAVGLDRSAGRWGASDGNRDGRAVGTRKGSGSQGPTGRGAKGHDHRAAGSQDGGSSSGRGGQDDGSASGKGGSGGGTDGRSTPAATLASTSGSPGGGGTSSGDGGSGGSGSPGGSTASSGSRDGGGAGSGSSGSGTDGSVSASRTTSVGRMMPTVTTSSDGGSGSDGGTSGGSGSSGSGDTTTMSAGH